MGKAVRAAFLALLLMALLGFPTVAFADDTDVERFDKQDALDNASLLLAAMMSNQNFAEYYGISCDVSDDLRMHDALEIYTKSEDGSECLVSGAAVWPVSNSDGLVATIVQFNDREGEVVYKLTSGLNECLGGGSLCFETKLVVDEASEGLSVESVVDCLGLEKKSMRQSNNQTGDIIQVADIAELQILPAQEPHAGSSALRAAYQPQLGLPRIKEPYSMYGWATCVASIAQYLTGSSLAIPYIYDNVHTANTPTNAGKLEVKRGLELHTYPGTATPISAMDWSGSIEDAEIVRWINNGIPFYIVFGQRALYTGLENAVIGGYAYDSSGKIVIIGMDPATGTYVNYSKGSGGTYVTSAGRTWYADSTFVYHFAKTIRRFEMVLAQSSRVQRDWLD